MQGTKVITAGESLERLMRCQMEAVTGQMYLAVLVPRLVGMHIVHSRRSWPDNDGGGR